MAGGIGITPLVYMAQRLARAGRRSGVPVRMLYGARSEDELAYLPELQRGAGRRGCRPTPGGAPIDFAAEIAALPPGGQLYTCGPVPMLEAVKRAWARRRPRRRPTCASRPSAAAAACAAQAFEVRIPRHDLAIEVPADSTLLEALEAAGVQTLWDCRRGECGLCAMDVLAVDGEIDHRDVFLSEHEKAVSAAHLRLRVARGRHDHHRFGVAARKSMSRSQALRDDRAARLHDRAEIARRGRALGVCRGAELGCICSQ